MEQITTAKIQIKVSQEEHQNLHNTMQAYTDACNCVSEYIYDTHNLKQRELNKALYGKLRADFRLGAQMAQSVMITVIAKYKTILKNQKEWIKPVFRKPQIDLVWNRDYSLVNNKSLFSVNTLTGRIKCEFYDKGLESYFDIANKFGTAKLVHRHDKFFLHIPITYEIDILDTKDVSNVVGIDRGVRFLATTYDSSGKTVFYPGNEVKQKRAHYKALRKELQQVGTPSSRRRLKAIGQRENRYVQDVNHCISKALVENNPKGTLHVLEDLSGIRSATEKVRVKDRYVMVSWSYYDLEQKLMYKALKNHQLVIKVDPRYTSQTCPKCGHTERGNRNKKLHRFCCKNCGYQSNDDRIGGMNLHRMGIDYLNNSLVPDAVVTE